MNNANTSFDMRFGREPSTALASALEKRSRRDVCACVPYSLLGELPEDEITSCTESPERTLPSNDTEISRGKVSWQTFSRAVHGGPSASSIG